MLETTPATASRRRFLTTAALGAAAVTLTHATRAFAVSPALKFSDIPGTGDIQVLNYALALEDLEADLYRQAYLRLTKGGGGINGLHISVGKPDVEYTAEFGKVEVEHRDFLRTAITAAGGPTISPFTYNFGINSLNRAGVLNLLYTAEKTGVSAYLGAIPLLSQDSPYLQIAGSIEGTEARHTAVIAAIQNTLFNTGIPVAPLAGTGLGNAGIDTPATPDDVLAAVSPFIVVNAQ